MPLFEVGLSGFWLIGILRRLARPLPRLLGTFTGWIAFRVPCGSLG